jgi:phospholipid/cholesterol/gamma-HCH transport system substrate-binding protein
METRANYVVVGTFVLIIIAAAFASVLWLAGRQFAQRAPDYYDIYFSGSAFGLDKDAKVRMSGVPIGKVDEIRLIPETGDVRVTVAVDHAYSLSIKQDSVAELEIESILTGVAYVEISSGGHDSPILTTNEGERYPRIPSKPSTLESLKSRLPELLSEVENAVNRVSAILDDKNRAAIAGILQNSEKLTADLDKDARKIDGLIDEAGGAVKQFHTTLADADTAVHTADDALHDARHALQRIDGIETDLTVTLKQFDVTAQHLDQLLQENRPGIRDFTQTGLTDLHRLISDARVLVQGLTRLSDELERDPSRFIWGDRREGYHPR